MRNEDKRKLEQLRSELTKASGRQPAQQEVLGNTVDFAMRHRDEFIRETTWKPLSDAEVKRWLGKTFQLGTWSAEDIDNIVYGDDA